jgi:hypothetical protein
VSGVSSVVVARYVGFQHTNLVEHLVTLIEHKALDVAQTEVLVAHKGVQTTGSGDNDVRVGLLVLKNVDVVLDGSATIEDGGLDVRQVLAETGVLVLDLESQLAGVAHDQHRALAVDGLDLLKGGQDENGSFTKTRLGLTKDVGSKNCLRNAVLLDCGYRMSDIGQKINARARASCRSISEIKLCHPSNNTHTTRRNVRVHCKHYSPSHWDRRMSSTLSSYDYYSRSRSCQARGNASPNREAGDMSGHSRVVPQNDVAVPFLPLAGTWWIV